jgi:alpha-tubulin suppressor-like RCC1 family protein
MRSLKVVLPSLAVLFLALSGAAAAQASSVFGWGLDEYNQVGTGTPTAKRLLPAPTSGLSDAAQVSASEYHSLAVRADGTVAGWGSNEYGEATNASAAPVVPTPTSVAGLANVVEVAAGWGHSLALLSNGTVMAWGYNYYGQLGLGTSTGPEQCVGSPCNRQPTAVPGVANAIAVATSYSTSYALLADGTVMAWGYDHYGQLGDGIGIPGGCECIDHPVVVPGVAGAVAIGAGYYDGIALLEDGTIRSWGQNYDGQLGNGTATTTGACECLPVVAVSGISTAKEVAIGGYNAIAALGDGTVRSWGYAGWGGLGNGSKTGPEACGGDTCSRVPFPVLGLAGARTVGAGYRYRSVLLGGGTVRSWGENAYGEVGDGSQEERLLPTAALGLVGASDLVAGEYTALAIVGPSHTLNVAFAGAGSGRVGTAGLVCPASNCSEAFSEGVTKVLRASSTSAGFAGFSGPCTGTGPCQVRMDGDQTVIATFGVPKGTAITKSKVDSKKKKATFTFSAPGAITGYECKLVKPKSKKKKAKGHKRARTKTRPPTFAPCTVPAAYRKLKPGKYTFKVRALDIVGPDATPAVRKFTIKKPKPKKKGTGAKR